MFVHVAEKRRNLTQPLFCGDDMVIIDDDWKTIIKDTFTPKSIFCTNIDHDQSKQSTTFSATNQYLSENETIY